MSAFDQTRKDSILTAISGLTSLVTDSDPQDTLLAQIAALTTERDALAVSLSVAQGRITAMLARLDETDAADAAEDAKRAAIRAAATA